MQSFYTTAVVNQIIEDRVEAASRARRASGRRRRRIFTRGGRRAAPLNASSGRLGISGAGR
jgi:hypothetical protein